MTPVQSRLLTFLCDYTDQHCCSPSFDEIKDALGLSTKSGVARLVDVLERDSWVKRGPGGARNIMVLRRPLWLSPYGLRALEALTAADLENLAVRIVLIQAGRRVAA